MIVVALLSGLHTSIPEIGQIQLHLSSVVLPYESLFYATIAHAIVTIPVTHVLTTFQAYRISQSSHAHFSFHVWV
jgi:hypothetical protein